MPGYVLHCTVCKTNYNSRAEWNDHLMTTFHQNKARIDLSQWGEEERKCGVVMYSSFAITTITAGDIVEHFFKKGAARFVIDVVLSESRPKMAIFQFESWKKVKEVMSIAKGSSFKIDGQLVQMKTLSKVLQLEWEELLRGFQDALTSLTDRSFIQKPTVKAVPVNSTQIPDATKLATCPILLKPKPIKGDLTINTQLKSIMSGLEIPDAEFSVVSETLSEVSRILEKAHGVKLSVELFRNNYLKLRNNISSKKYLAFIYIPGGDNESKYYAVHNAMKEPLKRYFKSNNANKVGDSILTNFRVLPGANRKDSRIHLRHNNFNIEIMLIFSPLTLSEQRMSRMVAYYCTFDSRIKQLLACVYYWAKCNDIVVANDPLKSNYKREHEIVTEPAALEWILLFFLCHCEKLIPTPEEVMKQPHKIIKHTRKTALDVGFSEDPLFVQRWKEQQQGKDNHHLYPEESEQYSLSILRILQKFFLFYADTLSTPCVLFTFDGKIIEAENTDQRNAIKKYKLKSTTEDGYPKVIIVHPLVGRWKLSVNSANWHNVVVPAMRVTAEKLENIINVWEKCPSEVSKDRNMFKKVFCVK